MMRAGDLCFYGWGWPLPRLDYSAVSSEPKWSVIEISGCVRRFALVAYESLEELLELPTELRQSGMSTFLGVGPTM